MAKPDAASQGQWPPTGFDLGDLRLGLHRQPSHGLAVQALVLSSAPSRAGSAPGEVGVRLAPAELLTLVNRLFALRFFDLPPQLHAARRLMLLPDGRLAEVSSRRLDTPTTTLCFSLPGYERCVRWSQDAPPGLDALAATIMSLRPTATTTAPPGS